MTLVGDGIENPHNARTMIDAAGMFGARCLFRDRAGLAVAWAEYGFPAEALPLAAMAEIARDHAPIIACDNLDGAADVYGFRPTGGERSAVVMGNERRGLAHDVRALAQHTVRIPMAARGLNCLNVAAASAVALYYLTHGSGPTQSSIHPQKRRPEVMLVGPVDHIELGSSIRSAGAFGWERLLLEDRAAAWFGCDRLMRAEGRGAARRGRNPIRVIPATPDSRYAFQQVCVLTTRRGGIPLHRARLAAGPRQLIAIPDETAVDIEREDWERLAREVVFVRLEAPARTYVYHYRLIASILLAEIARQVGRAVPAAARPRHAPIYDRTLELLDTELGETVFLDDLDLY